MSQAGGEKGGRRPRDGEGGGPAQASAEGPVPGTSTVEWVLAGLSAALVLGAMGVLLYEAVAEPPGPPAVEITVERITEAGTGYLVLFWARNAGATTAAGLSVEGELRSGAASVEKSTVTLDFVPAESRRRGGLFFTRDPRAYQLVLRPLGYDEP